MRAGGIVVAEARAGEREIAVDGQPGRQPGVVGPLETDAAAGPAGFGRPRVADEQQLGVETEIPQRDGRLQPANANGAQADLGALRADQRRHAIHGFAALSDRR